MEPWDYCEHWVKHISPDEFGYRADCVRELVNSTFGKYKFDTINRGWGAKFEKRPDSVLQLLEVSHGLQLMEEKLLRVKESAQQLNGEISDALSVANKILD